MKNKKIFITSLLLILAFQFSVFAGENSFRTVSKADLPSSRKPANMECKDGCKHYHHLSHSAINILKNKYGMKSEEIEKALSEGKTIFDIAKGKNITEDQLRALIISPKIKAIDEMVVTGEMSKEHADNLKLKLKEGLDKWDGKVEPMKFKNDSTKNRKETKTTNGVVE